jgi:hypothetical protein
LSKESRRRQRAAAQTASPRDSSARPRDTTTRRPDTTTRRPDTGSKSTERSGRRERARPVARASFVERYRGLLLSAAVIAVVAVVGVGLIATAAQPAFACSNVWQPAPTASPAADASPQAGYIQPDMGTGHVANGTQITYTYCPPASGRHYQAPNGPLTARVYGPGDGVLPQGWIHNLEHGGLVILYRGEEPDEAALRAAYDAIGRSPVCGFEPGGQSPGPLVARFDQMDWPYAALVWGRVLPLDTIDPPAIADFYQRYGEQTNPEKLCDPTASPSAAPSGSAPAAPS